MDEEKSRSLPVAKIIPIKMKAKANFTLVKPLTSKDKEPTYKTLPAPKTQRPKKESS